MPTSSITKRVYRAVHALPSSAYAVALTIALASIAFGNVAKAQGALGDPSATQSIRVAVVARASVSTTAIFHAWRQSNDGAKHEAGTGSWMETGGHGASPRPLSEALRAWKPSVCRATHADGANDGLLTVTVRGRLVDSKGAPVFGTVVFGKAGTDIVREVDDYQRGRLSEHGLLTRIAGFATTDLLGFFEIRHLPRGKRFSSVAIAPRHPFEKSFLTVRRNDPAVFQMVPFVLR